MSAAEPGPTTQGAPEDRASISALDPRPARSVTGYVRGVVRLLRPVGQMLRSWKARFGAAILTIFILVGVLAPVISPYDPHKTSFPASAPVSFKHLLGTTAYGQDILSQVIWGARPSLVIAFAGGLGATLLALLVGVTAGYVSGLVDHSLSFVNNVFLVLPGLPFMIVVAAYVPNSGTPVLVAIIIITGWAFGARQLRAQALSLRNRGFVEAAIGRGERRAYIIVFELIPTMIPLLAATFLGATIYSVLAAAGLQFLGLGGTNSISWGTMLYWAQNNEALNSGNVLWALVPGACIGVLGASLAFLNYGLDELANPALRAGSSDG